MKTILGLDLGTASIGWAVVNRAENDSEKTNIIACGSRVVPLSSDEKDNFEKGKANTTNADRRLKRSMRRNLQRRKQRRDNLVSLLREQGWTSGSTPLSEQGKGSTFDTLSLRARAVREEITLEELSRVLLSINNKRGYKSSRKTDGSEDGQLIDGMAVAIALEKDHLTPAEYCQHEFLAGKLRIPDFYRSDLEEELDRIWVCQRQFYPEILTDDFKKQISRQGKSGTSKIFLGKFGIYTADNKGKERRITAISWRVSALSERVDKEVLAYVISDLRGAIQNSSGYLGRISDRSKELFFHQETVGEYLYRHLLQDPNFSTRNKVFYRQDYIDEFNRIWDTQRRFHPELTMALKREISDRILFYQRPLKSQKGTISFCEFESHPIEVIIDGKKKTRLAGSRVAPKSSLLFQEFKIWQILNNLQIIDRKTDSSRVLTREEKLVLAEELTIRPKMKSGEALKLLGLQSRRYELNYKELEGNVTLSAVFNAFLNISNLANDEERELAKLHYTDACSIIRNTLNKLGCDKDFLSFNEELPKEEYEQQPVFKLWHLLYSYEGDKSTTGKEALYNKLTTLTGLGREYVRILADIIFPDDYASLSHKAIGKILPHLKEGLTYDAACSAAGYNHSHSLTAEAQARRPLREQLEQLSKGSLRNPVVEKILNQMVNVVNAAADAYGKPDEIHIELARELKQSAKDRERATADIQNNEKQNKEIIRILQEDFHLTTVHRNDILRYRLYKELEQNSFKTLYSDKYISPNALFSKEIDIEHIIPQARLFDDSFSNKTLEYKSINIEKGSKTANDFVKEKYGDDGYERYRLRVDDLRDRGAISEKKRQYLLMTESEVPSGFVDRDLRNSQYIARKAQEMLSGYARLIVPTTGSVTARLREDWQLVDVMKELNFSKYDKAGKAFVEEDPDGRRIRRIQDWTKRNDHRHHALDAITIAFTKSEHIQILNNLNARSDKNAVFYNMFAAETSTHGTKRIFTPPMPLDELRAEVKRHLDATLVSIKAKNKVVTRNINKTRTADGTRKVTELTPRGALHKEQVYGKRLQYDVYEVPVNAKMTEEVISNVASAKIRKALFARLESSGFDPKKAFTGKNTLDKSPIFLDTAHASVVPPRVKCVRFKTVYSIRKEVGPDLSVEKIMDGKVRTRIQERIRKFGGDIRAALSNLDANPIWLDDAKTIPIKSVTIAENFDLCAIRSKRDKDGRLVLDAMGNPIATDFVNLRNNHHVALYLDETGQVQEMVVPLFEALNRINQGLPVVNKTYHADLGWHFLFSMKVNEMFVFPDKETGFDPDDLNLTDPANASRISPHLFRVQKLSSMYYCFRHHQETTIEDDPSMRDITWKRVQSIQQMKDVVKVRIDHLGRIVSVGEYD